MNPPALRDLLISWAEINSGSDHSAGLDRMRAALATEFASLPDATVEHVPLTEAVDAAEVATPAERAMLMPLIAQKMQEQIKSGKYNRTLISSLARRLKALQSGGGGEVG